MLCGYLGSNGRWRCVQTFLSKAESVSLDNKSLCPVCFARPEVFLLEGGNDKLSQWERYATEHYFPDRYSVLRTDAPKDGITLVRLWTYFRLSGGARCSSSHPRGQHKRSNGNDDSLLVMSSHGDDARLG